MIETQAVYNDVVDPKLGYYRVGKSCFINKVQALIDGTRRNIHPEWIFNNDVFNRFDWSKEPVESLDELYRQRAQQIRDSYDYMVLMYSAGSDSENILQTCLRHNIRIDEVVVTWGVSLPHEVNPNDYSHTNLISEWELTIKPKLEWLAKNHPKIKITVYDWAKTLNNYKVVDGFVETANHCISPYLDHRWNIDHIDSVKQALESKSSVVFVRGAEKPRICFHNGAYRLYFLDVVAYNAMINDSRIHQELFYWSPDACKIIAKQAHSLVKFIEAVPNFRTYITWPNSNPIHRQWYEYSSRAIIYPDLDLNFFQTRKPTDPSLGYDVLLFGVDGLEDRVMGILRENQKYLLDNVDRKYFQNPDVTPAFIGFIVGMYPLKTVV